MILDGKFLVESHDPLVEADHFGNVADLLVNRMDRAAKEKSRKALDQLGKTYFMVMDKGIHRNLDRAQAAGLDSPEHQRRIEEIIQRNIQLQLKLEKLLEQSPEASRPQLRKALDLTKRPHQPPKRQQQQQQTR